MTEQEYSIMQELKLSGGRKPQSWLESMDSVSRATVRRLLIDKLLGYTGEEPDGLGGVMMTHICLSDKGRVALAAEEEARKAKTNEKAEEYAQKLVARTQSVIDKKQQRHDQIVGAAVGACAAFILEHLKDIVDFVTDLIESIAH